MGNCNIFSLLLYVFLICFPFMTYAEKEERVTVSPLILISYGKIVACGVKVSTGPLYENITAEIKVQHKDGRNIFSVHAGYQDPEKNKNLEDLSLKTTSIDTSNSFSKATFDEGGFLHQQAALDDSAGARFIQELLVMGGNFLITKKGGKSFSISLPKPISHSIRQAYLSCAGDLIGPETD